MNGQAFEFTPGGVQPLAPTAPAGVVVPAGQAIAKIREQFESQERSRTGAEPQNERPLIRTLQPGSLVKQIRERLRVIRAELKALRRLEHEEAELKRLLAAAKAPPAAVTHITSARKSG